MIVAEFSKRSEKYVSFELSGHADAGPYGSDIVCAGVSALAFTTVNSLAELAGFEPLLEIDNEAEGYLYCEVLTDLSATQQATAQVLMANLFIGLRGIENEYSDYLKINVKTNT